MQLMAQALQKLLLHLARLRQVLRAFSMGAVFYLMEVVIT
jgi:hypothetical protein